MKTPRALFVVGAICSCAALWLCAPELSVSAAPSLEGRLSNASDDSMQQQIVSKEREGLEALKAGNVQRFGDLTADDAIFVDGAGLAGKTQVLTNVNGFTLTDYTMENIQFARLSGNTGLISYKITEKGNSHGRQFAARAYVSSIWAERHNRWLCLFSQETAAR
jgi:ketosteroid isomerase-like protein